MAPPIWLPPLNSLDQYKSNIYVKVSQFGPAEYDESEFYPQFLIEHLFSVKLISDCKFSYQPSFEVLSMEDESFMFCHEVNSKSITSLGIMEKMLNHGSIPFDINQQMWRKIHITGTSNDGAKSSCFLSSKGDLLEKIWEYLCWMKLQHENANKNILPLKLEIEKMVIIPDEELKAWNSWYAEMKRNDPNFERDFREAIKRQQREENFNFGTTAASGGATKSSNQELETVECDDSSTSIPCAICLEEFIMGSQVTELPCSHLFHGDCVMKWLQQSHVCPLCRFVLSTDQLMMMEASMVSF